MFLFLTGLFVAFSVIIPGCSQTADESYPETAGEPTEVDLFITSASYRKLKAEIHRTTEALSNAVMNMTPEERRNFRSMVQRLREADTPAEAALLRTEIDRQTGFDNARRASYLADMIRDVFKNTSFSDAELIKAIYKKSAGHGIPLTKSGSEGRGSNEDKLEGCLKGCEATLEMATKLCKNYSNDSTRTQCEYEAYYNYVECYFDCQNRYGNMDLQ